jgi:hypothetical protein
MPADRDLANCATSFMATDARGRLTGSRAQLYILRTADTVICRCHVSLSDEIAAKLQAVAARPRGRPREWAGEYADYLTILSAVGPIKSIRAGPLYAFHDLGGSDVAATVIGADNADLLSGGLDEWRQDAHAGLPMMAIVRDGRAVSICTSAAVSQTAHSAGVETLAAYRGRGFARQAVAAWARAVQTLGAVPFYATTFDNLSSQRVASRLGLDLVGSEFSVECANR